MKQVVFQGVFACVNERPEKGRCTAIIHVRFCSIFFLLYG